MQKARRLFALSGALLFSAVVPSIIGLSGCSTDTAVGVSKPVTVASTVGAGTQWIVGWGAPPENALPGTANPGGSEQSFRSILLPTIDGVKERVHFSNLMGTAPVTIGAARIAVALGAGPAVDSTRDAALTFSGSTSITIPAGEAATSDPVNVSYKYGEHLAVSVYLQGSFSALTLHDSQVATNFATAVGGGDTTADASGTGFTSRNTQWYMVTGVDLYGSYQGTVAVFGSSSIDGHNSNYGDTSSYPALNGPVAGQDNDRPSDWLARELLAAGYRMGVLNAGQIADPAGEDAITQSGRSGAGVDRMNRDVLQQAGIQAVVIYFGGVDLRVDCKPATDVETSLTDMVQQAKAAGLRVILATLPPAEYCLSSPASLLPSSANPYQGDLNPGPENPGSTQRRMLNDWIRTTGAALPGVVAIADFDAVLKDPNHPDFMIANLNSGDNFHPNGVGYGVQSAAIPLKAILGY